MDMIYEELLGIKKKKKTRKTKKMVGKNEL